VILVDDGIATGTTMKVAITAIKGQHTSRIVVAVPVAPASTCKEIAKSVDEVVCLFSPDDFWAIGVWYLDFSQVPDEEVCDLLRRANKEVQTPAIRK
jgi:predicted phosphoribosyltransferase